MKKTLIVIVLFIFLFAPIYANTTVTTDYRQGSIEPLSNPKQLIVDTTSFDIVYLNFNDMNPFNLIIYLGGYPEPNTIVNQTGYWFTWQPTGEVATLWFIR